MLGFNSSLGQHFQVNFLIPGQDVHIGESTDKNGKTSALTKQGTVIFYELE